MGGIQHALLVLLQVLVVGERQALHRHQKLHQVAVHAAGLTADELGEVGVLLLRHDGGARRVGIGERDEAELRARPQDDLLGQAREVHGAYRAGVLQVEQEVAVGHRVERVGDDTREPELEGGHATVERIARAGQGRGAQRTGIGRVEGVLLAIEIALEHPRIGEQMMRQQHRLRMLQMRVAGKDRA